MKLLSLFNLEGRVAVITGGAGWLGTSMSEALVELGARVFIASRNRQQAEAVCLKIAGEFPAASVEPVALDVSDQKSVEECFHQVNESAGRLDILVNNAYSGAQASLSDTSELAWQQVVDVGLTGYFRCMQAAARYMKEKQSGVIINVSSMYGLVSPDFSIYRDTPYMSSPAYGAAKAGVLQLSRYGACQLAARGIRVNSLTPGPFPGSATQGDELFMGRLAEKVPLGRTGQPWELKGAIAFLSSDASSYMTGQNLVIDGGWTAW